MLRVVKVPETGGMAFFLLCDHRQCMEARRGDAVTVNPEEYGLSKRTFVQSALQEGWWIDVEGGFCPFHARELAEVAKQSRERGRQIVAAKPEHVRAFG